MSMRITIGVIVLVLGSIDAAAQDRPEPDPWAPLQFLVGDWTGEESASFGKGRGERSYRPVLQGRYLLGQNRSRFEPQEGLPAGDTHEDWTIFSYDTGRQTYVLRQFNSEGFVNTLAMEEESAVPGRMVFALESSENAPPNTLVRLTIEAVSEREFRETFEVTFPGQEPMTIRNRWTKVKD